MSASSGDTKDARGGPPTRARIIEAGRRLFNVDGLQAAALYRVAAEIGISPGNLNYHFKNKAELAIALADMFEAQFARVTGMADAPLDPAALIDLMREVLTTIWRYSFLFVAPQYHAAVDDRLVVRVEALRQSVHRLIRASTRSMIEAGLMRTPRSGSGDILADNIVAVWMYWLQAEHAALRHHADSAPADAIAECLEHHFGLLEPYLSTGYALDFTRELAKLT